MNERLGLDSLRQQKGSALDQEIAKEKATALRISGENVEKVSRRHQSRQVIAAVDPPSMRSKYARYGCAYIGALILAGCASSANRSVAIGHEEPEIRAARARFNTAIAERDTATIASIFLPEYHIVTGKNDQGHGIASEVQHWRGLFADKSLLYVRRTREVRVNDEWGIAEELGDWTGHFTAIDGSVSTS